MFDRSCNKYFLKVFQRGTLLPRFRKFYCWYIMHWCESLIWRKRFQNHVIFRTNLFDHADRAYQKFDRLFGNSTAIASLDFLETNESYGQPIGSFASVVNSICSWFHRNDLRKLTIPNSNDSSKFETERFQELVFH